MRGFMLESRQRVPQMPESVDAEVTSQIRPEPHPQEPRQGSLGNRVRYGGGQTAPQAAGVTYKGLADRVSGSFQGLAMCEQRLSTACSVDHWQNRIRSFAGLPLQV